MWAKQVLRGLGRSEILSGSLWHSSLVDQLRLRTPNLQCSGETSCGLSTGYVLRALRRKTIDHNHVP